MATTTRTPAQPPTSGYARAFLGLFLRDLHVLRRELFPFVLRIVMNPLLFLFVFTYVMPHMSGGAAMNPTGNLASTGVASPPSSSPASWPSPSCSPASPPSPFPSRQDFGSTREIDDRVMCPLPTSLVAMRKDRLLRHPGLPRRRHRLPARLLHPRHAPPSSTSRSYPFLILVVILACLVAGALGLAIGTAVKPQQIGLIFCVVVIPITFLGCVYYPWTALGPASRGSRSPSSSIPSST